MLPMIAGLGVVSVAELLLWTAPAWRARRFLAPATGILVAVGSLGLIYVDPAAWTGLFGILAIYRCINLARVAANRIHEDFLFHSSRRTSLWLIGCQVALAGLAWLSRHYGIGASEWWTLAAAVVLIGSDVILMSLANNLRAARPPKLSGTFTGKDLPAVTVAIPARNETEDLEECLNSLVNSTYPKLEILVLDDCSQNKRTPEIIRGFAHAGVRFIAGSEPPASWLAKNFAYDKLTDEASGDLLLFCGVDARFEPGSLDMLVRTFLQEKKDMLSLVPRNRPPASGGLASWFMQANRYAWELALPRRTAKRPPVLSTCWLITAQTLRKAGGFEAVRRKGVPESYFARSAARSNGYSFLLADSAMGITSVKTPDDQRATAVRTRYLQMHRRPEMTALISLAEAGLLVMPFILLAAALVRGETLMGVLAALAIIANVMAYSRVFNVTYRRFFAKGLWLLPLAASYDVWLLNYSMWQYEFREVIWKGRNVCIPLMRTMPRLPASE